MLNFIVTNTELILIILFSAFVGGCIVLNALWDRVNLSAWWKNGKAARLTLLQISPALAIMLIIIMILT